MLDNLTQFLASGGPFMLPILAVLAAAIAVILERTYFYFVICRQRASPWNTRVQDSLRGKDTEAVREQLHSNRSPVAATIGTALKTHAEGASFAEVQVATDDAILAETPRYMDRLDYLSTCANVATMTGLLGTIFGLQASFRSLALADAGEKATLLASGISQAMNTTAFGLLVAILCMVVHARLVSRRNQLIEGFDLEITRTLRTLEQCCGPVATSPVATSHVAASRLAPSPVAIEAR